MDVWDDLDGPGQLTDREEVTRAGDPDLIVTVGGDGTFLRGVRVAALVDAVVLGVNVGRVGFLTEVTVSELRSALNAMHAGAVRVEERLTLTMRASRPLEIPT
jgi:NAD+ kinase